MRHLLLAMLFISGCGDDTSAAPGRDMQVPVTGDLAHDDLAVAGDGGAPGSYATDGGTCLSSMPAGLNPYAFVELVGGQAVFANLGLTDSPVVASAPVANGACTVVDTTAAAPPQLHDYTESAGALTITGGAAPIALEPGSDNDYTYQSNTLVFAAGAPLGLDFAGACDVPPTHLAFTYPTPATLSTTIANTTIARSNDLALTWTAGSAGGIIEAVIVAGKSTLSCQFDSASSGGTVPKASLAQLAAGSAMFQISQVQYTVTPNHGRNFELFGSAPISGGGAMTLQ